MKCGLETMPLFLFDDLLIVGRIPPCSDVPVCYAATFKCYNRQCVSFTTFEIAHQDRIPMLVWLLDGP